MTPTPADPRPPVGGALTDDLEKAARAFIADSYDYRAIKRRAEAAECLARARRLRSHARALRAAPAGEVHHPSCPRMSGHVYAEALHCSCAADRARAAAGEG